MLLNTYSNLSSFKLFSFIVEPSASISVSSNEVCKNESAIITFTGSGGEAPYTFTYELNGLPDEITTVSGSSIDIILDGATTGDFTYKLTNVQDSAEGSIPIVITGQEETIKVNELPKVDFSIKHDNVCSGETVQFTNASTGEGTLTYE